MKDKVSSGHLLAAFTVAVWGTTYISTKVLLRDFLPTEILFIRFLMGISFLFLLYPKRLRVHDRKRELTFMAAGLCGICLYYLLENIALVYTYASNVGVIIAIAPCLTAIVNHFIGQEKGQMHAAFFAGFVIAIIGVFLISFNGATEFHLNPKGDILAALAALVWAFYSVLTRKIGSYGYHPVASTRRIFLYGTLFILPALAIFGFHPDFSKFRESVNLLNILFLGFIASAICFVTWNTAVKKIGAVKTSVYIYLNPVVTVVTSILILKEQITWMSGLGMVLTLGGLVLSERPWKQHGV